MTVLTSSPELNLQFVIVVFPDHTHLLFLVDVSNEVLLPEDVTLPSLFTQWKALLTSSLKLNLILTNFG